MCEHKQIGSTSVFRI